MVGEPVNAFPPNSCDTHIHVYDGRHPAAPTATLFPPDASIVDYRRVAASLGLERVVLVQPSTYGRDNSCQLAAASELAAASGLDDAARLVVVVDEHTSRHELARLDALGARGARFHMLPGGALGWEALAPTAAHIAEFGWHIQLQINGNLLGERVDTLLALPTSIVVDHVGRFMPPPDPGSAEFGVLLRLVDSGRFWVKLSGPYESATDPTHRYEAVGALAAELVRRAPERMLWASNWPHPGQSAPPDPGQLRLLAERWLPSGALRQQVLVDNPAVVYGFAPT